MHHGPMPLVRIPEPFDHPDWLFEVKHDGFRALAVIEGHTCRLVSRRGHVFAKFGLLAEELAYTVRAMRAVLDGEIVCVGQDGRSRFYDLLFRREWPSFFAFDLLELEGEDLRPFPLIQRKRRLKAILPRSGSRVLYVDHIVGRGSDLFREACRRDLEGIVGKWRDGRYETDGVSTSWVKVKNPTYSQMEGRREVFETRTDRRRRSRAGWQQPTLRLRVPQIAES
jgi:bifunctional non-homologous end joining protein LigD